MVSLGDDTFTAKRPLLNTQQNSTDNIESISDETAHMIWLHGSESDHHLIQSDDTLMNGKLCLFVCERHYYSADYYSADHYPLCADLSVMSMGTLGTS